MSTSAQLDDAAAAHFIQCRIPSALYEWLRLEGFRARRSMTSIILASVMAYHAEAEAGRIVPQRGAPACGEIVKFNLRIDDALYEWLRTTAFDARAPINDLIIAALARSHAAHPDAGAPVAPAVDLPEWRAQPRAMAVEGSNV